MDIFVLVVITSCIIGIIFTTSASFIDSKNKFRQKLPAQSQQVIQGVPFYDQQVKSQCPYCQKTIEWNDARFCSACGTDLNPQCSQCHIPLRTTDAFCYKCGQSVGKNTPPILSPISQSSIPTTVKTSAHCPYCTAATTTQDTFCGSCGKSLVTNIDQTMQK